MLSVLVPASFLDFLSFLVAFLVAIWILLGKIRPRGRLEFYIKSVCRQRSGRRGYCEYLSIRTDNVFVLEIFLAFLSFLVAFLVAIWSLLG